MATSIGTGKVAEMDAAYQKCIIRVTLLSDIISTSFG
jgi:hypothetical protein